MIGQYWQSEGERVDNNRRIVGYAYKDKNGKMYILRELDVSARHSINGIMCEVMEIEVKPETIKRVAVKQITEIDDEGYFHCWCPNCHKENMNPNAHFKHCPECGQSWIDWSDEG